MKTTAKPQEAAIREPLYAEVIVKAHPNGEALFVFPAGNIVPGDVVSWEYPKDGLKVKLS